MLCSKYFIFLHDDAIFKKVKLNTNRSQIYKKNDKNIKFENIFGLIRERFKIKGKQLQKPTFDGKGRYIIPIKIIKTSKDYLISFSFNYLNLKTFCDYFAEYELLKYYEENARYGLYYNKL